MWYQMGVPRVRGRNVISHRAAAVLQLLSQSERCRRVAKCSVKSTGTTKRNDGKLNSISLFTAIC